MFTVRCKSAEVADIIEQQADVQGMFTEAHWSGFVASTLCFKKVHPFAFHNN